MIEVNHEGDSWIVYRRFSAFDAFHQALGGLIDNTAYSYLTKAFPEKEMGSLMGTLGFFVDGRFPRLQRYFSLLLLHPVIKENPMFHSFLDFDGRGASGAIRSLGPKSVLKHGFVKISDPALANLIWYNKYVVLTQTGMLYTMQDFYDSEAAGDMLDLVKCTRVGGNLADAQVELHFGTTSVFLRFESRDEVASWMRTLSDFATAPTPYSSLAGLNTPGRTGEGNSDNANNNSHSSAGSSSSGVGSQGNRGADNTSGGGGSSSSSNISSSSSSSNSSSRSHAGANGDNAMSRSDGGDKKSGLKLNFGAIGGAIGNKLRSAGTEVNGTGFDLDINEPTPGLYKSPDPSISNPGAAQSNTAAVSGSDNMYGF
jgi:hypothetical protein